MHLPIDALLPAIREALRARTSLVLQAPPGAGKTTRVPLALLAEDWLAGSRIVMLEPRRLPARAAAAHMASLLGEEVGRTVGYRMRMDTRVSAATRIEVVTEGVLTRMLQHDPALGGIGLLIFDEFHERSLNADLGLALALQARSLLRPDLRILVMSATLDTEAVAALLEAETLSSEGTWFPVETVYLDTPRTAAIDAAAAHATRRALRETAGDVLVFLPGEAEIARTASRLESIRADFPDVDVLPLYGNLPLDAQQRAIRPSPQGRRKIVLATSIAETSLTIEGVTVVIDSGWMRVPRFSPRTGMTRLETLRVTRDAADQRRGRAGRTRPGRCYRLWSVQEEAGFLSRRPPEILQADLAPLALELAIWGVAEPAELQWLDPPPAAAYAQARELLAELGALDANGKVTGHGRRMAELPVHPRIAHLLLRAVALGATDVACDLAALLEERDLLHQPPASRDPDIRLRLDILQKSATRAPMVATIDRAAVAAARARARQLRQRLPRAGARSEAIDPGVLLAFAYPDRIARRRAGAQGRFLLRNGSGARVSTGALLAADWIVAAQLTGHGPESTVRLGAPVAESDVRRFFDDQIERVTTTAWDAGSLSVRARQLHRIGAITWNDAPLPQPDADSIAAALLEGIRSAGLDVLPWNETPIRTRQRLQFLHELDANWPDCSDDALLASLEEWLLPRIHGRSSIAELQDVDLTGALLDRLTPAQRHQLETLAPTHFTVPSGSRIAIDYSDPQAPAVAVRLQEVFGLRETPRIARGRVPLTFRLLSPAMRPVQVTRDLASFWETGYFDVRKDLRGRYPKHDWPEDPLKATPIRGTRRRQRG